MRLMTGVVAFVIFAFIGMMTYLVFAQYVPPGNVGVKVYLLGGSKGVDSVELPVGRYWIGWNEKLYLFPTFTQNYTWSKSNDRDESIEFQTVEGMKINADIGISYNIIPNMVSKVFQKYRKGIDEITDIYLRNMVRDALVTQSADKKVDYIYGAGKAELMKAIQQEVRDEVAPLGINVEKIYWIGPAHLPAAVQDSINDAIRANQKAQQAHNEIAKEQAEAQKKVAEATGRANSIKVVAQAQADANRIIAQSLTPELVQYRAIEKWQGELPRMIGGSAPIPFISADKLANDIKP